MIFCYVCVLIDGFPYNDADDNDNDDLCLQINDNLHKMEGDRILIFNTAINHSIHWKSFDWCGKQEVFPVIGNVRVVRFAKFPYITKERPFLNFGSN
jgi:hypothetical protein